MGALPAPGGWLYAAATGLYAAGAVGHGAHYLGHRWIGVGRWAARAGWLVETAALVVAVAGSARPPVYTMPGAVLFFTWFVALNYLLAARFLDLDVAGAFLLPIVVFALVYAAVVPGPEVLRAAALRGQLLVAHVIMALASYGAFTLSFVAAVMYLLLERQLRGKAWGAAYRKLPALERLDRLSYRWAAVGFPLLTAGVAAGAVLSHVVWGRYWIWSDPKEVWTLLTWLAYGVYLWGRGARHWAGRRAAWLSVSGFGAVCCNFFIVTVFLSRLHAF